MENKHDVYGGKNCMKKFYKYLREHAIKIINFKQKKNEVIKSEQQNLYQKPVIFVKSCAYHINLLVAQDLWLDHYQILSMIVLNEFIKLNVNTETLMKKM